jgi:hypothetical protein
LPFEVAAADLNGDGRPDVVASTLAVLGVSVLANAITTPNGMPGFAAPVQFAANGAPLSIVIGDVNDRQAGCHRRQQYLLLADVGFNSDEYDAVRSDGAQHSVGSNAAMVALLLLSAVILTALFSRRRAAR